MPLQRPPRAGQEPAAQGEQQTVEDVAREGQREPAADEQEPHPAPDDRDAPVGAPLVTVRAPERGPREPAAVERVDGQQVDRGQEEVQDAEDEGRFGDRFRGVAPAAAPRRPDRPRGAPQALPDRDADRHDPEAGQRSGRRDDGFVRRPARLPPDGGGAAEEQQRDDPAAEATAPRDEGVRQFVHDHGCEEQERDRARREPEDLRGPRGMKHFELAADAQRDDGEDQHPTDVDADLDPEDLRDRDAARQEAAHRQVVRGMAATSTPGASAGRRRRARAAIASDRASRTTARAIEVSDQNGMGKSWTRRSLVGSKV